MDVTHIVSALNTVGEVIRKMNPPQGFDTSSAVQFVNLSWLSACLKYGKIVDVDDNYRIPNETQTVSVCIKECIEVMCVPILHNSLKCRSHSMCPVLSSFLCCCRQIHPTNQSKHNSILSGPACEAVLFITKIII